MQQEQQWRVYAPVGRNTTYDHKMNLRNMHKMAGLIGGPSPLRTIAKQDYGDDVYKLNVKDEEITVVARERGQRTHAKDVFEELEEGIFLFVTEENHKEAEGMLVKMFM